MSNSPKKRFIVEANPAEGKTAIRVELSESDSSSDVVAKIELAGGKIGRTSAKEMLYERKGEAAGFYLEINGSKFVPAVVENTNAAAPAAKTAAAAKPAATVTARAEKVYALGPNAEKVDGRGTMARLVAAVRGGINTQPKLMQHFPDIKKPTLQHELCRAMFKDRQFLKLAA